MYRIHYQKYDSNIRVWYNKSRDFSLPFVAELFIYYMRRSPNHIYIRTENK